MLAFFIEAPMGFWSWFFFMLACLMTVTTVHFVVMSMKRDPRPPEFRFVISLLLLSVITLYVLALVWSSNMRQEALRTSAVKNDLTKRGYKPLAVDLTNNDSVVLNVNGCRMTFSLVKDQFKKSSYKVAAERIDGSYRVMTPGDLSLFCK